MILHASVVNRFMGLCKGVSGTLLDEFEGRYGGRNFTNRKTKRLNVISTTLKVQILPFMDEPRVVSTSRLCVQTLFPAHIVALLPHLAPAA